MIDWACPLLDNIDIITDSDYSVRASWTQWNTIAIPMPTNFQIQFLYLNWRINSLSHFIKHHVKSSRFLPFEVQSTAVFILYILDLIYYKSLLFAARADMLHGLTSWWATKASMPLNESEPGWQYRGDTFTIVILRL